MLFDSVDFDIFGKTENGRTVVEAVRAAGFEGEAEAFCENGMLTVKSIHSASVERFEECLAVCADALRRAKSRDVLACRHGTPNFGTEFCLVSREGVERLNISEVLFRLAAEKSAQLDP